MEFNKAYEDCYARNTGKILTVGNGYFERSWRLEDNGPRGISLTNKLTGCTHDMKAEITDFQLPDGREPEEGRLAGASAEKVAADGFTSSCLRIGVRWEYGDKKLTVRWDIKLYPGAPGLWTRLYAMSAPGNYRFEESEGPHAPVEARSAYMPLEGNSHTAFGYYNDTQNRNKDQTEIIREEPVRPEENPDWASVFLNHVGDGGWMAVKESHKCPNQSGYDTGRFVQLGSSGNWTGLSTTGWGLQPDDLRAWKMRGGWANWFLVWGGDLASQDALKSFDRARYPFDRDRDVYMMANTWGSNRNREPANFDDIAREVDIAAHLGIDVLQIDDGWQTGKNEDTWVAPVRWQPDDEERFPGGWQKIRSYYKEKGVTPGLWAAWVISDEELLENLKDGGFKCYKIDFAVLNNYEKIEGLFDKARHLIDASGATVRINWDVTENPPRVGYFFGREFGNIYLENRKPDFPQRVVYTPRLVLRDAWQLSRWLPLSKFQITFQNADRVDPEFSNARYYPHDYLLAITLMASPIFFQELQYLSEEAKASIKPLITAYKEVREEILTGLVSPLGDKPCDKAHTGFQCETGKDQGYLTLFRELHNEEPQVTIALKDMTADSLTLTDLLTGGKQEISLLDGRITLEIKEAPGFRFFRYEPK